MNENHAVFMSVHIVFIFMSSKFLTKENLREFVLELFQTMCKYKYMEIKSDRIKMGIDCDDIKTLL